LIAFYDVVTLNQKTLNGIKSIGNGAGAKFVEWYNESKTYYDYLINLEVSHCLEEKTKSPLSSLTDSKFWKRYAEAAILWDQLVRNAGLKKYIDENEINKFKLQFEIIKKYNPNEKIID
jgi:hypothetical protein